MTAGAFDPAAVVPAERSKIERSDWETPPAMFRTYDAIHRFTLDVAANAANRMVPRYFDREHDGLRQSWAGERVWMHPPHDEARQWCEKASREAARGTLIVGLIPARTWEAWWHESVYPFGRVRFLCGFVDWRLHRLPVRGRHAPAGGFAIVEWHPAPRRR